MASHFTPSLSLERPDDMWEIEALLDTCFAPGRTALSSYRLRENTDPLHELCYALRDHNHTLIGCVRNWPVLIDQNPCVLLGPIAVHPTSQGEGLAAYMMTHVQQRAKALGHHRIILVGDEPYYARFGFKRLNHVQMPPPTNPERILGCALAPSAWDKISGKVRPINSKP